jgi:tRNA uridine 5-carboxymethylaminomethyl modification enzyme
MIIDFDVIIVGGGHAGIEAAYAAARMGVNTALITLNIQKIGLMPCNPAIGGVGKGHIVFEVSALGGLMPKLCTKTYLQARMLNTSKGPAVQGLRLQIDKFAYNKKAKDYLANVENLTLIGGKVERALYENNKITGVVLENGDTYTTKSVVFTTGTFLNGRIHIGQDNYSAGRRDEEAVISLSDFLRSVGLQLARLKTGTPPRLLKSSLDFSKMQRQEADNLRYLFEFTPHTVTNKRDCFITHTNERTHEVIKQNLYKSAMYNGNINGIGPRYCPSIEDKIGRFPNKLSHHVFVEPEGESADEIYPNGISTSLPLDVQKQYVQTIVGFENAIITKVGYAVEYDFVLPNQLKHTLETKIIDGLFLAGQINGTTGYEEAAGQGIVAGINAALRVQKKEPFILSRTESYIGVMIDDLVTMGVDEPYRMFTSRAERRLLLRQDNAFLRLTDRAYNLGLIDNDFYQLFSKEKEIVNDVLSTLQSGKNSCDLLKLLGSEDCSSAKVSEIVGNNLSERAVQTVRAQHLYGPYLVREEQEVKKIEHHKKLKIPQNFTYLDMSGLSKELQQKLTLIKPETIAQAAIIPGMTPAAVSLLIINVRKTR